MPPRVYRCGFFVAGLLLSSFLLSNSALAHLKGDPGVACFRMVNDQVVEIPNPLHGASFADILDVQLNPNWRTESLFGVPIHVDVRYRIAHCRPYNVFVHPLWRRNPRATPFSSPSPTYEPGEKEGTHTGFVGFNLVNPKVPLAQLAIDGIRVTINEYGTGRLLASRDLNVAVNWKYRPPTIAETETCTQHMNWPTQKPLSRRCSNVADFHLKEGFRVVDRVDLNHDGTCELLVEVESCRKLNNNICYKIFAERDNRYQEIWQYYNRLRAFENDESGHPRLGSTETGPVQHVHRMGIYDGAQGRYVTQRHLEPCR